MIVDLYNAANAARTCSLVRSKEIFAGFLLGTGWWMRTEAAVFEQAGRGFAAYAAWDKNEQAVDVVEVEALDEALYPALLAFFAQQAVTKRCEAIRLHMPARSSLCRVCAALCLRMDDFSPAAGRWHAAHHESGKPVG